jgi:hypothetical protein
VRRGHRVDAYLAIYGIDEAVLIAKMAAVTQRRVFPQTAPMDCTPHFPILLQNYSRNLRLYNL